jgi:hypothetical protein
MALLLMFSKFTYLTLYDVSGLKMGVIVIMNAEIFYFIFYTFIMYFHANSIQDQNHLS